MKKRPSGPVPSESAFAKVFALIAPPVNVFTSARAMIGDCQRLAISPKMSVFMFCTCV
jgi:hypothetical protein